MKVAYCLINPSLPGGIERSVCCKANYLADVIGYDITIITTDRGGESNFYDYSKKIKFVHLDINYADLDGMSFLSKLRTKIKKRITHRERLSEALAVLKSDIVISTYTHELSILSQIETTGKKIVEIHFNKSYKNIEYKRKSIFSLERIFALMAENRKQQFINKYDSIVVLSKVDKVLWGNLPKIEIIPNIVPFYPKQVSSNEQKRVISVGRLTHMKGYELLIKAWYKVFFRYPDWELTIIGDGKDKPALTKLIQIMGMGDSVSIIPATKNIEAEYIDSAFYVMPSLSEGFGLVLVEAMSCGLSCISFNSSTGLSEIITHGKDGLIVETGNIDKLSEAILFLIENKELRMKMGKHARENVRRFLPDLIMQQWVRLFEQITSNSEY